MAVRIFTVYIVNSLKDASTGTFSHFLEVRTMHVSGISLSRAAILEPGLSVLAMKRLVWTETGNCCLSVSRMERFARARAGTVSMGAKKLWLKWV